MKQTNHSFSVSSRIDAMHLTPIKKISMKEPLCLIERQHRNFDPCTGLLYQSIGSLTRLSRVVR